MKRLLCGVLFFLLAAPSWGMENHTNTLRNQAGRILGGATVKVYLSGTTTLATIYSDNGVTLKSNPFLTDALTGQYNFYAANGAYDLVFTDPRTTFNVAATRRIILFDPADGGGGGGGANSVGLSGAVQASDGAGALLDTGCTGVAGALGCSQIDLVGAGIGKVTVQSGVTQAAPGSAGQVTYYFNSSTGRLESIANGGSAKDYVTTADSQTLSNKLIRRSYLHTVAGCNNGVPGPVWNIPASNAAVPECDPLTNRYSAYLAFNDTTDQGYQEEFILPVGYSGGIDWKFRYKMASATSGNVGVCARLVRVPTGAASDPAFPAQGAGNCGSQAVPGTAGFESDITITNVTCTSCVAGDRVQALIERDANGSAVSDTAMGDMRMLLSGPIYSSVE